MRRLFLAIGYCLLTLPTAWAEDDASLEFFEREIRPILVNHCYECHDAESGADAANLRLDYRGGWQTGGDSGPAIDANNPDSSLLLRAVSYDNPDLQMPPRSKLPAKEIELLKQWVAAGAVAPDESPEESALDDTFDIDSRRAAHWAWQPVARPALPEIKQTAWPSDDIDHFILARLEQVGLAPADETEKTTWLRRVTFDLTGLPPTAEEVRDFLNDGTADAHAKVVDRLLGSTAFAECWAQHWLDLMRYAESKGHEQDFVITQAWKYRDYVIRAFESNVPYNQFVVEHIAGDLLPTPRVDPTTRTNQSIQATGWWHLGEATHSPVDIRGDEADRIDNQIDVFGKAFLGMTIACARCHDHKFDAISTDDYYALCGFVQSSSYQLANVADPELQSRLADELATLNQANGPKLIEQYAQQAKPRLERALAQLAKGEVTDSQRDLWTEAIKATSHPLHLLAVAIEASHNGGDMTAAIEAKLAKSTQSPATHFGLSIVDFAAMSESPRYNDWLTSGVAFGPGPIRAGSVLTTGGENPSWRLAERAAATNLHSSSKLSGLYRTRTFQVKAGNIWYHYRGKAKVFLAVDSHRTVSGPLHAVCKQQIDSGGGWQWFAHPAADYQGHRVHVDFVPDGEFELAEVLQSDTSPKQQPSLHSTVVEQLQSRGGLGLSEVAAATGAAFSQALGAAAQGDADTRDSQLVNWLLSNDHFLPVIDSQASTTYSAAVQQLLNERSSLEQQIPKPQHAMALMDGAVENEFVHLRGSHKRLADSPTPRRFLTALGGELPIQQGSGRLELAQRLASGDNPLFARTWVNRVWAHLMGGGIVESVDNLGVLGQPPTHPELLDYLASEFTDSGWDTKLLIRRLVLSSTYHQASRPAPSVTAAMIDQADPANQLLHATRVRRLPAEAIRDSLLAIAGQLDATPYGPSVPIHITNFMRHNRSPDHSGPMDGDRRRSIYLQVRRNAFNHFLAAFDKPVPSTTVGYRHQSNSASQPLMLLNDPLVHHLVDKWAHNLTTEFSDNERAIQHAYLSAFARQPTKAEQDRLARFINQQIKSGSSRTAAWQDACLALANSKEFIFLR